MPPWLRLRSFRGAWVAVVTSVLSLLALPARSDVAIPKAPERWVTDTAGLISEGTRAALDARLQAYEAKTGHQVVVWIGQTIGSAPLDDFAVKAFESWRIGRKGHDDGVLMLVLARDRKIDIEIGYGLEDRLTDALSHRIIDEIMAPRLRAGDPDAALSAGVDAVLSGIEGHPVKGAPGPAPPHEVAPQMSPATLVVLGILAVLLLLFFVTHPALATYFLFSILSGGGSGRGSGGGGFGGGFSGGGGRSGGGGARGGW
jgi:uncharacterized protein